jgi:hypothetical protein
MIRLLHRLNRDARNALSRSLCGVSLHHRVQHIQRLRGKGSATRFLSHLQEWISPETPPLLLQQPAVDLYRLQDCRITGLQGHIFPEKHLYLDLGESLFGTRPSKILPPIRLLEKKLTQPLFYLAENSVSRAHAVMEHLPRYQIAAPFLPPDIHPLVQKNQTHWQSAYLKLAGCNQPCCETSFGTLSAPAIYFVPLAGKAITNLIGEPRHYLEAKMRGVDGLIFDRRPIFISRNDASRRRLLNEADIFRIARSMLPDIKLVELSELSLRDQITIVGSASVLISPHGQGSHLSLFGRNAVTIQLVPGAPRLSNSFFECALLYDYFASLDGSNKTVSIASDKPLEGSHEHWSYPSEKFARELVQILQRSL